MISLHPIFPGTYVKRGEEYFLIKEYHKAIELQPTNKDAYYDRGYCRIKIGQYEQGIDDIKIAACLGHKEAQNLLKESNVVW